MNTRCTSVETIMAIREIVSYLIGQPKPHIKTNLSRLERLTNKIITEQSFPEGIPPINFTRQKQAISAKNSRMN